MPDKEIQNTFLKINIFEKIHGKELSLFCLLIVLFLWAYWPAYHLQFRVEQWAIYDHYKSLPFPASLAEWGRIAFWTPLGDYRFIPLAYIWNYFEFKLFGVHFGWYTTLSLALYAINAILVACLARLYAKGPIAAFWMTLVFALFLPSAMEIAIWTFFSYKLLQISIILCALRLLEMGIIKNRFSYLLFSLVLCFISTLFYEALVLLLGFWICKIALSKIKAKKILTFIGISLAISYGILSWFFAQISSSFDISPIFIPQVTLEKACHTLYLWIKYGWVLNNTGLLVDFREGDRFITFHLLTPLKIHLIGAILFWYALLSSVNWRKVPWGKIGMLSLLLILSTILILAGRASTNVEDYLSRFSMYNYIPIVFISPILGLLFSSGWATQISMAIQNKLALGSLCLLMLLWVNVIRTGVETYVKADAVNISLMQLSEAVIKGNNLQLAVTATNGPYEIPSLNLLYSGLHLMHGDRVINQLGSLPALLIDDYAVEMVRKNPNMSPEDFKRGIYRP
jgi:hypothetical protein